MRVDQFRKFPADLFEGYTPEKFTPVLFRFRPIDRQPPDIFDEPEPEKLLPAPVANQIGKIAVRNVLQMVPMTNNHIRTEDAVREAGRNFYRTSRSDIERLVLENGFIDRNSSKGLGVGKYHFEFVRECFVESDFSFTQPHVSMDNQHRFS